DGGGGGGGGGGRGGGEVLFDGRGGGGREEGGLPPDFAEDRHRGHVTGLGDLLKHERRIEDRQAEAAIFLRHRHAENAQLGERLHVVPWEGAVHPAARALAELALRQVAHGRHKTALLVGQGREQSVPPRLQTEEYGCSATPLPLGGEEAAD